MSSGFALHEISPYCATLSSAVVLVLKFGILLSLDEPVLSDDVLACVTELR
jgi:hypothetical protein